MRMIGSGSRRASPGLFVGVGHCSRPDTGAAEEYPHQGLRLHTEGAHCEGSGGNGSATEAARAPPRIRTLRLTEVVGGDHARSQR